MRLSDFDEITIKGTERVEIQQLAERLDIKPEEVVSDALRLLKVITDNGLYVKKGRLTAHAPVMHALGLWREIMSSGATGRIEVATRHGPVAYRLPQEAFQHTVVRGNQPPSTGSVQASVVTRGS